MRVQRERNERLDLRYCSQVMGHLNCYSDLQRRFQAFDGEILLIRDRLTTRRTLKLQKRKKGKKRRRKKKKELEDLIYLNKSYV